MRTIVMLAMVVVIALTFTLAQAGEKEEVQAKLIALASRRAGNDCGI